MSQTVIVEFQFQQKENTGYVLQYNISVPIKLDDSVAAGQERDSWELDFESVPSELGTIDIALTQILWEFGEASSLPLLEKYDF